MFLGFMHILDYFVFHGIVVVVGFEFFPFIDLLIWVIEDKGAAVYESIALGSFEIAL